MGFGRPTGIDLPNEGSGHVPQPAALQTIRLAGADDATQAERRYSEWYPGNTLGLAIGQASLTVTPLQIARLMAAIANDGELVTPTVVRDVRDRASRMSLDLQRGQSSRSAGLSSRTLEYVRAGLEQVIASKRGTGHRTVFSKEVTIAGKTGTAEVGGGRRDNAWFAGYAPAERPQIAFVVVLEHGGSGGRDAGPMAKKIVERATELGLIVPVPAPDDDSL